MHLSDSVIFEVRPGPANEADIFRDRSADSIAIGTGRILDIDEAGNVTVTVDSGEIGSPTVTVDGHSLIFAAHNNAGTVSQDFNSANPFYGKQKASFDEFVQTGNPEVLRKVQYNEIEYALMTSSMRINSLGFRLSGDGMRDHGIQSFIFDDAGRKLYGKAVDAFNEYKERRRRKQNDADVSDNDIGDYDSVNVYDVARQYYDAVANYNMAK